MTDNPDPGPSRDHENDRDRDTDHDWPADDTRHRDHGRHASPPARRGPSEDIRHLSEGEERDLHFNGYPPYNMQPLHELCYPGGCQYKTEAENCADLEDWYASAGLTAEDDPEAEL
jgi:hypothetical protein